MNLSIFDLIQFLLQRKIILLKVAGVAFICTFGLLLLFQKPSFMAEASFRQGKTRQSDSALMQNFVSLLMKQDDEPAAISLMGSKTLLGHVVAEMGLQVEPVYKRYAITLLKREVGLKKSSADLLIRSVEYDGDYDVALTITAISETGFSFTEGKDKLKQGKIGEEISFQGGKLSVAALPKDKKVRQFRIIPKREAIKKLKKSLKIKIDRKDGSMIHLTTWAQERETAKGILHVLMHAYQDLLLKQHEQLAKENTVYLQTRRDELSEQLVQTLDEYTNYLQKTSSEEGYLGLAQAVESLSEPKEKYTAQKHQVDVEIGKWEKSEKELSSFARPWKQGHTKREEIDWQARQLEEEGHTSSSMTSLDLPTVQVLYSSYGKEYDNHTLELRQLGDCVATLSNKDASLSSVMPILQDGHSQSILALASQLERQIGDQTNHSERELERIKKEYDRQKELLLKHLSEKQSLCFTKLSQLEAKLTNLRSQARYLLHKERENLDKKLSEIAQKTGDLPEKWRLESQFKIKKELTVEMIEEMTKLCESKVIDQALYHISSRPIDPPDAPPYIEPPHLFLYSSAGGISAFFLMGIVLLLHASWHGFPLSKRYLLDRHFRVCDHEQAPIQLAREIKEGETIAVIGGTLSERLHTLIKKKNGHVVECTAGASTLEAHEILQLANRFIWYIKDEKTEDLVSFEGKEGICVLKK